MLALFLSGLQSHDVLQSTEVSLDSLISVDTVRRAWSRAELQRQVWAAPGVCEHQLSGTAVFSVCLGLLGLCGMFHLSTT